MNDEAFVQRDRAKRPGLVDPQDLITRLLELENSVDRNRGSLSPSLASTAPPLTEEEEYLKDKQYQAEAYHTLINSGGRPSHTLDQMETVVDSPGEIGEILSFWQAQTWGSNSWKVFSPQATRWQCFLRFQRHARQQHFGDEKILLMAGSWDDWDEFLALNTKLRIRGGMRYTEYVKAARERLLRNGFTQRFQPCEDLSQQDKLTTWIEYLNYEYLWFELFEEDVEEGQQPHDDSWMVLVRSEVLQPGETEENILSADSKALLWAKEQKAEEDVKAAKLRVATLEAYHLQPQNSNDTPHSRRQQLQLAAAYANLAKTSAMLNKIRKRCDSIIDFIRATRVFRIARENAHNHVKLLRWILSQIPIIELESTTLYRTETNRGQDEINSAPTQHKKNNKRQRSDDDQPSRRESHKRARVIRPLRHRMATRSDDEPVDIHASLPRRSLRISMQTKGNGPTSKHNT
ncbi:Cytochrome P450 [Venturia nashicola]|uniref:Cytochrome P450 n=1 Tax=Venturia nashicola TaxID=86259 RepID=A0A4Z1PJY0_9PEZI|nr:Cytochrome P450 [Venturia nashicola]